MCLARPLSCVDGVSEVRTEDFQKLMVVATEEDLVVVATEEDLVVVATEATAGKMPRKSNLRSTK